VVLTIFNLRVPAINGCCGHLNKDLNNLGVFISYGKKRMKKYPLIGVSIVAVVVLILASLSNVVGFQTVQSSNQTIVKDEANQKELLFKTILDIVNNKEVQRTVINSETRKGEFFNPDVKFSILNNPVLTKNQLNHMYYIGLMLSKIISKSKIHSIIEQYQVGNQGVQKEITAVIEKDAVLRGEMTQLSNSKCDCGNENTTRLWNFPVLCFLLLYPVFYALAMYALHNILYTFLMILKFIGQVLNCSGWDSLPFPP
jgi:hypothetical protein